MITLARSQRSLYLTALICVTLLFLGYHYRSNVIPHTTALPDLGKPKEPPELKDPFGPGVAKPLNEPYTRTLVIGRLRSEDVSWTQDIPNLNRSIYTVDDENSVLKVPKNKGHEAMVYLTYIIDNYDNLPDTVLFFHPHRSTWHNNILLDLDSAKTISRISDAHVARQGYMNSRCHLDPGCPDWLHPDRPEAEWDLVHKNEERFFTPAVWRELHPNVPVPRAISQPCCAQFAVSGERIRAHPRTEYIRYREWLLNTELEDENSGRIMEYTWQYIFTGQAEFCPSQHQCYCDGYGICFGGTTEAGLQNWLDLLKQRERADEMLDALRQNDPNNLGALAATIGERDQLNKQLDKLKGEAYKRGEDPRNRAMECGRPYKEGDGF
jgi:Protein of unknown function (DUF3431)